MGRTLDYIVIILVDGEHHRQAFQLFYPYLRIQRVFDIYHAGLCQICTKGVQFDFYLGSKRLENQTLIELCLTDGAFIEVRPSSPHLRLPCQLAQRLAVHNNIHYIEYPAARSTEEQLRSGVCDAWYHPYLKREFVSQLPPIRSQSIDYSQVVQGTSATLHQTGPYQTGNSTEVHTQRTDGQQSESPVSLKVHLVCNLQIHPLGGQNTINTIEYWIFENAPFQEIMPHFATCFNIHLSHLIFQWNENLLPHDMTPATLGQRGGSRMFIDVRRADRSLQALIAQQV